MRFFIFTKDFSLIRAPTSREPLVLGAPSGFHRFPTSNECPPPDPNTPQSPTLNYFFLIHNTHLCYIYALNTGGGARTTSRKVAGSIPDDVTGVFH